MKATPQKRIIRKQRDQTSAKELRTMHTHHLGSASAPRKKVEMVRYTTAGNTLTESAKESLNGSDL